VGVNVLKELVLQLCVLWVGGRDDLNLAIRCKPMSDHGVRHSIVLFSACTRLASNMECQHARSNSS
jgi:hypothetical protein